MIGKKNGNAETLKTERLKGKQERRETGNGRRKGAA
jgi:hypothetical protein